MEEHATDSGKPQARLIWRVLKGLGLLAALMALVFLGSVYWYFYSNHAPKADIFALDIDRLRNAAEQQIGEKPSHIEVEIISHTPAPRIAMVAGTDWGDVDLVRTSYRIVTYDGSIILDTGHSEIDARESGATEYDGAAWARTREHIVAAKMVLVTHAHGDHSGGLDAATDNAWLSTSQQTTLETLGHQVPQGVLPIDFDTSGLFSPAAGVVIVAAAGHTPGSQLVYVQLADGGEVLFMGDTASMLENVQLQRPRSRFVMEHLTKADRGAVFAQTRALKALSDAVPELALVPGHDAAAIEGLIARSVLKAGFAPVQTDAP